jgi:hypothetical protein
VITREDAAWLDSVLAKGEKMSPEEYWDTSRDTYSWRSFYGFNFQPLRNGLGHVIYDSDGDPLDRDYAVWIVKELVRGYLNVQTKDVVVDSLPATLEYQRMIREADELKLPHFRRDTPSGYVYVAESGDLTKIGVSQDPNDRIKKIRSPNGGKARLVMAQFVRSPYIIEHGLHRIFRESCITGEWFRLDDFDMERIDRILVKYAIAFPVKDIYAEGEQ